MLLVGGVDRPVVAGVWVAVEHGDSIFIERDLRSLPFSHLPKRAEYYPLGCAVSGRLAEEGGSMTRTGRDHFAHSGVPNQSCISFVNGATTLGSSGKAPRSPVSAIHASSAARISRRIAW